MVNKTYLKEKIKLREEWAGLDKLVDEDVKTFSEQIDVSVKKGRVEEYVDLGSNVIKYHYGGGMKEDLKVAEESRLNVNYFEGLKNFGRNFGRKIKSNAGYVVSTGITCLGIGGMLFSMYLGTAHVTKYRNYIDEYVHSKKLDSLGLMTPVNESLLEELGEVPEEERSFEFQYLERKRYYAGVSSAMSAFLFGGLVGAGMLLFSVTEGDKIRKRRKDALQ